MLSDITRHRLVPVVVCSDAGRAGALGEALVRGGLPIAEVTFRTAAAVDTIATLARRDDLLVGAGTVLSVEQVERAAEAGARFIVSPGLDADVVARARDLGLDVLPGCVTPTEIMAARKLGITTVKFFPAGSYGGAKAIAALSAPFGDMRFVPTGGVSPANLADYLGQTCIPAVGGSWMVPAGAVDAGDVDALARLCAEAVAAAAAVKN